MMPNIGAKPSKVSVEELYLVISGAASQDPAQVQQSSRRLTELFLLPGAFDALSEIVAQKSVPLHVRQQSIIQLKNAALAHWKSRKLFTDEEKQRIKERCLALVDEPDDLMTESNELIVAKIARLEYPQAWPTLISDLVGAINTNVEAYYGPGITDPLATLRLRRCLELVNAILKELSSSKMSAGVKNTRNIIEQIQVTLRNHYVTAASALSTTLNPTDISNPQTCEGILLAHLIFKCLAKSTIWLWQRITTHGDHTTFEPWVQEAFQNSALQYQALLELRINVAIVMHGTPSNPASQRTMDMLTRHLRHFGKFFRRIQQLSPTKFVELPVCGDLVLYNWSKIVQATNGPLEYIEDSNSAVFPVRILVQAMVLFKESLAQWTPVTKKGATNERVLSKEFVEDAVRLLVTRFIPLNPSDLQDWSADPEEWVNLEEKDNDSWEYTLRPCGERVLMTLVSQYRQYVVPLLVDTFKQSAGQIAVDLSSVLQKEALYCAIGRCAIRLKGFIPFEQWLEQSLLVEARDTNPAYPIIKRRIAWLIGKWISDDCSPANNPKVYDVLVYLLQDRGPGTDAVVRLTAAVALRECVDTLSFSADVFTPYLPTAVKQLLQLTAETETLENKRRISDSLNVVIERAETLIVPYMGTIAESIPQLWTEGGGADEWLFKASLLVTVQKLIEAGKEQSYLLCALVVPLVRDSFAPGASMHLDEDALNLWRAALRNMANLEAEAGVLLDLFPLALQLLAENLDLLGSLNSIMESYILLAAPRILQVYALDLFRAYAQAISHALITNVKDLVIALELLVQISPPSLYGEALHLSGLFFALFKPLTDNETPVLLSTEYIYFLARLVVSDKQLLLQLISATAASQNITEAKLYETLLDQWWTRFDNMSEPYHRKLAAMGIANLVSTGRPEVLDRLSTEICNLWLDVFGEIKEAQTAGSSKLSLYWDISAKDLYKNLEGTAEYIRRKATYDNDPVRTTQLTAHVTTCIHEAEVNCGGGTVLQSTYLAKADPTVLKQIQAELVITATA